MLLSNNLSVTLMDSFNRSIESFLSGYNTLRSLFVEFKIALKIFHKTRIIFQIKYLFC